MKNKYYSIIIILFFAFKSLTAQDQIIGRIIYQLQGSSSQQSTITMLFTKNNYIYHFGTENPGKLLFQKKINMRVYKILLKRLNDFEEFKIILQKIFHKLGMES